MPSPLSSGAQREDGESWLAGRRRLAAPLMIAVSALALVAMASGAAAVTPVARTLPHLVTPPTPNNSFAAVTCVTTGSCVAAGEIGIANGVVAAVDVQSGATWTFVEPPLPVTAGRTTPASQFNAVTCASPGNCVAVGSYIDRNLNQGALLDVETSGTWTNVAVPLPPGAAVSTMPAGANPPAEPSNLLTSVSCSGVGACTAVGSYTEASGFQAALLVEEGVSGWSAIVAPLPADASTTPAANALDAISCASAGACVASGSYEDANGSTLSLLDEETAGTWADVVAPLPGTAAISSSTTKVTDNLNDVACTAAASCIAVGGYQDTGGDTQLLVDEETAGVWANDVLPLPAGASTSGGSVFVDGLDDVTCTSAGNCVAVGNYQLPSGNHEPLVEAEASGTWSASRARVPTDANVKLFFDNLTAISCTTTQSCVAVGLYVSAQNPRTPTALVDVEVAGTWTSGDVELPADLSLTTPYSTLGDIACTDVASCIAVGVYLNTDGDNQALLDSLGLALMGVPVVPTPPTGVRIVPGHGQAKIEWAPPANDGGSTVLQYTASAFPGSGSCTVSRTKSCTIRDLPGNVAYRFSVVATSAIGTSPPSIPLLRVITPAVHLRAIVLPFPANSAVLTASLRAQVRSVAAEIGPYGDSSITLTGFSDTTASPARNQIVSVQRAEAVAAYLSARLAVLGIPGVRITWSGRGQSSPIATNASAAGRAQNRRVEVSGS